jgi:hypothetical protein
MRRLAVQAPDKLIAEIERLRAENEELKLEMSSALIGQEHRLGGEIDKLEALLREAREAMGKYKSANKRQGEMLDEGTPVYSHTGNCWVKSHDGFLIRYKGKRVCVEEVDSNGATIKAEED